VAYGNLGDIYQIRGDLKHAEAMYAKSLNIDKVLNNKGGMAKAYGNLGLIYETRGNLDQAEAMYRTSLALFNQPGTKYESTQLQRLLDALRRQ
jgi:Flp pilus assembly protein TadD